MSFWEAVLLGIVQGVFMFFPVSSTSHLVLAQHLLGFEAPESAEMILFDLVVHVGTLVSIAVVFRQSLGHLTKQTIRGLREFVQGSLSPVGRLYLRLTGLGLFSVFITGVIGLTMRDYFESFFASPILIAITLTITGILLWWTDILPARKIGLRQMGLWIALVIGVGQGLALMPGLSRSGTTIAFALFAGMKRRWAAEYSFFVAIPTILAASAVEMFSVMREGGPMTVDLVAYVVGFLVAAIVGIGALMVVLKLLYAARFRYFSYYVWLLAAGILWMNWRGVL
ncbi:undecaprenyl-diphosphate phosphatase [soil metagenome]